MKRESLVFLVSGTFFGVLVGWILGSQQGGATVPAGAPVAAPASANQPAPPPLDVKRAGELEQQAKAQPANAAVRVELANLYYDAQRFDLATPWYEAALKLNPKDVNVSTDLAVAYHYEGQTDRALAQIDRSLAIDPTHAKTYLNQGYIRAFGKQDLDGAAQSWQKVVDLAPGSEEAKRAKQALEAVRANHPPTGGRGGAPDPPPSDRP